MRHDSQSIVSSFQSLQKIAFSSELGFLCDALTSKNIIHKALARNEQKEIFAYRSGLSRLLSARWPSSSTSWIPCRLSDLLL